MLPSKPLALLPPPPLPPLPLPPQKRYNPSPLNQIVVSKQSLNLNQQSPVTDFTAVKPRNATLLRKPRRTNPFVWCYAIICLIFSLLLIIAGISTLIIYLAYKPRYPLLETTSATLNSVYLDSPDYVNGDFIFLANFSNPNRKIDVRFQYLEIELYFFDRLIATQALQAFSLRPGEVRLDSVHMLTSEAYLPPNLALELRNQLQNNRIRYNIRGTFRVRLNLGLTHISYWLYGRCQVEMSGPPYGVLVARSCRTKR
ncbi:NDR1/HIN1-like protein 13 [Telopea speciosissima]|uniref:NDR1/HIN1-like protein 13 n=1 Tax=Telopea speciosissima TaxID=54955 RepID=UPI001CC647A6|nr:NDR1/HIN1-like protein 13 [Telopea speciosissima]